MTFASGRDARVLSMGAIIGGVLPLPVVFLVGRLRSPDAAARLTRDLASVAGVSPLNGALSSVGAFLWFGSGAVLLFTAAFARDRVSRGTAAFLLTGAALSFYLWFDDFFMLHESLAPRLLGLDERLVYGVIVVATGGYLTLFRRRILATEFGWLAAALGVLGASMFLDLIDRVTMPLIGLWTIVLEDGCKWLGVVCWARYQVGTAYDVARRAPSAG